MKNETKTRDKASCVNSISNTVTVSIRNMDKDAWHSIKLVSVEQNMTLAELMSFISERLDMFFK